MRAFGSGNMIALTTGPGGVVQGRKFGVLQNVQLDIAFDTKELYGQFQFPVEIARAKGKIEGKASYAEILAAQYNEVMFGQGTTAGQTLHALGEVGVIPAASSFTVTVANSATFSEDLGVAFAATGVPLTRVAATPAAGQYSVAAGVYTFASADASKQVLLDYAYTVSGTGQRLIINNQLMGVTPTFALVIPISYAGKALSLRFNRVVSSKMTLATKQEDFLVPDVDFKCFADAANQIGTLSFAE